LVIGSILGLAFLNVDVLEIGTLTQEVLERCLNFFLPEEVPLAVLVEERASLGGNLIQVVGDLLHSSKELELVLNFNQVISSSCFLIVDTLNLNSNRNEVIYELIQNISDSRLAVIAANRGLEGEFIIYQINFEIEDGRPHVLNVKFDVDLVTQVLH
jgi:hypothetical protein